MILIYSATIYIITKEINEEGIKTNTHTIPPPKEENQRQIFQFREQGYEKNYVKIDKVGQKSVQKQRKITKTKDVKNVFIRQINEVRIGNHWFV